MQIFRVLVGLLLLALSSQNQAAGAAGPDLELICPCTYETASSSSVTAGFGVINRGSAPSGTLVLRAYAHTEHNYFVSSDAKWLGDIALTESLAAESIVSSSRRQVSLVQPPDGSYFVTFLLLEDNVIADMTRMRDRVTFGRVPGESFSDLYFVSDPSISTTGSDVVVSVPGIGNSGVRDESVEVLLAVSESEDFFAGGYFVIGTYDEVTSVAAGTRSLPGTVQFEFEQPGEGFDFIHLVVTDGDLTLLVHTVEAPGIRYSGQAFLVTSLDYLKDIDGDGVSDDNERFAGTDPYSGKSTPEASTIDILVAYTGGVESLYDGDPSARLDHLIAVSNTAFADSGIELSLRIVGEEKLDMDSFLSIFDWLDAAEQGSGSFKNLQQLRDAAGADLVTLFRRYDGQGVCGLATLGGYGTQGFLSRDEHINASFIEFDECEDITMVHEVGHNLGLGHSVEQDETGTFNWSRGYGVQDQFATIMTYASDFNVGSELPIFSNPGITVCEGQPCGVAINKPDGADAARSLNAVRFQAALFSLSGSEDTDGDGVADADDAFVLNDAESTDTDGDGLGDNADFDDDNDGLPDGFERHIGSDPQLADAADDADTDGVTNIEEFESQKRASQFLQLSSRDSNITQLHIINRSAEPQSFLGSLIDSSGTVLGEENLLLGNTIEANGRLILTSEDLELIFDVPPWKGSAMLEVTGAGSFSLMSRLISPSGLATNTNCARQDRALNIEGFDSDGLSLVRFVNTGNRMLGTVTGTLYDADGEVIGRSGVEMIDGLMPKQQLWLNRNQLANRVGARWDGEAMLEVSSERSLKLLNLKLVDAEAYFNFSCFEDSSGRTVYLQHTSNSRNVSTTHIVNTSDVEQVFKGTLLERTGRQLGEANQVLGTVPPHGRLILSSVDIQDMFAVEPWKGPAMLQVEALENFELMTKMQSRSGLVSGINCVRRDEVHSIPGTDSPIRTFLRVINAGNGATGAVRGSLYNSAGNLIGEGNRVLFEDLLPRQQVWLKRAQLIDIFGESWHGDAMLKVKGDDDLRLMNLNYVNSDTFFNFSCYEESD
jgi:hypothetical protein